MAGREELDQHTRAFLANLVRDNVDGALNNAQQIFLAMPSDPGARVSPSFFDDRWHWIAAVARRAQNDGSHEFVGRIGLMTQIWNRMILAQDPRMQGGRLTPAPIEIEIEIYGTALRSLLQMQATAPFVPGENGWSVGEATGQVAGCIERLKAEGVLVPEHIVALASGAPETVAELNAGAVEDGADPDAPLDRWNADVESEDEAQRTYAEAVLVAGSGDLQAAFELLQRAAMLGHVEAMSQAGVIAEQLGNETARRYWLDTAASAGSRVAMYNLGLLEAESGHRDEARQWLLRAAEAGNTAGYAALLQIAEEAGDDAGAQRWAAAGAAAKHPHCLQRHGYFTYQAGNRTEALEALEEAGELGNSSAMVMAGIMHNDLGNPTRARYWLLKARDAGSARAAQTLNELGLA
jgi:hypothetical protein